ncbi:MAG: hypothetical protein Q7R96_01465 [Nanoarchaeota archaeon]|nr:hypothetical protein [Nanoarchaeota archaeon]
MKILILLTFLLLTACTATLPQHHITLNAPEKILTGIPTPLTISLLDRNNKPLPLEITHEKLLHIMIISENFDTFTHLHPETIDEVHNGNYTFTYNFPQAGTYLIGIDYQVQGERYNGKIHTTVQGIPTMQTPIPDYRRELTIDSYTTNIDTSKTITANIPTTITYTFENNEQPLTTIEPHLGAPLHIAVVSEDLKQFYHIHGTSPATTEHNHHTLQTYGPTIETTMTFPTPGTYYLFSTFQHEDTLVTNRFAIKVEE